MNSSTTEKKPSNFQKQLMSLLDQQINEKPYHFLKNSILKKTLYNLANPLFALKKIQLFYEKNPQLFEEFFSKTNSQTQLLVLFSNSPILSQYFLKSPESYCSFFPIQKENFNDFKNRLQSSFKKTSSVIALDNSSSKNLDSSYQFLRLTKIKEFIKISLSDYLQLDSFEETILKISLFAETALEFALTVTDLSQYPIAIIAMGKLGGRELNYNSDIDLMFVVNENDHIKNYPLIKKKIFQLIDLIDKSTADGSVFRVDLQIRPEGHQGYLFLTLKQYQQYYQHRAKSWEFQALIKGRYVAGNQGIGEKFEKLRMQFVFHQNSSSQKMLFNISRMKKKIETFFNCEDFDDVKLSPGGIRDIEFIVQFLQIHHGKVTKYLNTTDTLSTLKKLFTYKIITFQQYSKLYENYCFLRKVEHYLQLKDFLPTRKIPQDPELLFFISHVMGYSESQFLKKIKKIMLQDRELFSCLFEVAVDFHEKLEEIFKGIKKQSTQDEEENLLACFDRHIEHLESDYFLNFTSEKIIEHIKQIFLLDKNPKENSSTIKLLKDHDTLKVDIITHDHMGIFSLISLLLSLHGISITSGASFLYAKKNKSDSQNSSATLQNISKEILYNSFQKTYSKSLPKRDSVKSNITYKKIIFSMVGKFVNRKMQKKFNNNLFIEEFNSNLKTMEETDYEKVMEKLLLSSIKLLEKQKKQDLLKPINISIDNLSHPIYTIADIESEDSFLFLFYFTYTLSYKGYYIVKIEFDTPKERIRNRLFLTNSKREKINDQRKITDLKSSILMIKYFSSYMTFAPNPALAYKTFNRLINKLDFAQDKSDINNYHSLFQDLAKVLGTGEVILEDFLRLQHDDIRDFIKNKEEIKPMMTKIFLQTSYNDLVKKHPAADPIILLNQFKDQFLFHLDLRLLMGEIKNFSNFCLEMSNLTDLIMEKTLLISESMTMKKFSLSRPPGRYCMFALGKWGSQEMGYASDIEIVFVYDKINEKSHEPNSSLPMIKEVNEIKEFYETMGKLIPTIIKSKKDGIFEVDLRLRPDSESSPIAIPLHKFKKYYSSEGHYLNYEKLVLTRLRVVEDTGKLGQEVIMIKNRFVYHEGNLDLQDCLETREKQIKNLIQPDKGRTNYSYNIINVKFSPGGLVEVEYLVQILSIVWGKHYPTLMKNSILKIIDELIILNLIDKKDYLTLKQSYKFLRNLINCLRISRGNAKDMILPENNSLEMEYLKRIMVSFKIIDQKQDVFKTLKETMEKIIFMKKKYFDKITNLNY